MSKKHIFLYAALCAVIVAAIWSIPSDSPDLASLSQMPARNSSAPYDGGKRIAKAVKMAKQSGKLVLIQSSSQGCSWCHVLHNILTTNKEIVAKIDSDFVYVLVDTTNDQNRDFYKKYASNTEHTLVLVVMDTDGRQIARKIGDEFVEGDEQHYHISPDTMLAFLNNASPKR